MKLRAWLDKLGEDMSDIKITLAKQESNIEHHVKRSDLLEEVVEIARQENKTDIKELRKEVESNKRHVYLMKSLGRIIVAVVAISGVVVAVLRYLA